MPSEPITAARLERLAEEGLDGFMNYLLPHAALKLKQGFGRLIRSRQDTGVVVLLDSRVVTKRYGQLLLSGLPRAERVVGSWAQVRTKCEDFFARQGIGAIGMMPLRPSKIIGIGRNYLEHARELGNEVPAVPILFFKPPTALIGPGDPILLPNVSQRVEFEAEIGVVIGRRIRHADPGRAERAIGGLRLRQRCDLPRPAEG